MHNVGIEQYPAKGAEENQQRAGHPRRLRDSAASARLPGLLALTVLALMVGIVANLWIISSSEAIARVPCTQTGTAGRDFMAGTDDRDKLCARGDRDYLSGGKSGDILLGGPDHDTIVGNQGPDRLRGGRGNDKLFAIDDSGRDVLRGGVGTDSCYGDDHDRFESCEVGHRGREGEFQMVLAAARTSAAVDTVLALSQQFFGAVQFGEQVQIALDETTDALAVTEEELAITQTELTETKAELAELQALIEQVCSEPPAPPPICGPKS